MLEPGQRVCLSADPARCGTLTNQRRVQAGRSYWRVQFPDLASWHPEDALVAGDEPSDPLQLLRRGSLGRSTDLRKLLTHVRLSGRLANIIYSMETTNTDFYAYQFKPVLKFLNTPAKGMLIADEVGLGKTIEAGLIWTELRSRMDYRRLLVLCPAVLKDKWKAELTQRFGIRPEVRTARELLELFSDPAAESRHREFAIICTLSSVRPRRGWDESESAPSHPASQLAALLRDRADDDPLIDLLVIDEAHYLRNPETLTNTAGMLFSGVADRVVMLSATPVHLRSRDLFQLLMIADQDTFTSLYAFDGVLAANEPLVKAREMLVGGLAQARVFVEQLRRAQDDPFLKDNRQLQGLVEQDISDEDLQDPSRRSELAYRLDQMNLLGDVISRTRKREVQEWRVIREAVPEQVTMNNEESALYSAVTAAVRAFAARYSTHEGFLLVTPQRQMSSCMPAAVRAWREKGDPRADTSAEDFGIETDLDDELTVTGEIIRSLGSLPSFEMLRAHDTKFATLAGKLTQFFSDHPDEKIVIFSYFIATLNYLQERLAEIGLSSIILSGSPDIDKTDVLRRFREPEGPRILISSEVGSEGVDLQFCRLVVNYDLPWNPMRLEQRVGRLDRLGQTAAKIIIWNLMYDETIDSRIYNRLYQRLNLFERTLGGLEATLGGDIRTLTNDLLRGALTADEERERIDQTAQALETLRQEEERLEEEAPNLVAYGDYILRQVKAARELHRWISGEDLRNYVIDFLQERFPGCRIEHRVSDARALTYDIALSHDARFALHEFVRSHGLLGKTALAGSDTSPVRLVFENKMTLTASGRVEIINQLHPIVRFVSWSIGKTELQFPVAIRLRAVDRPVEVPPGQYAFLVQRWAVTGLQEKELLFAACVRADDHESRLADEPAERLLMAAANRGIDWPEVSGQADCEKAATLIADVCTPYVEGRFDAYVRQISDENSDRANLQLQSVERHYQKQFDERQRRREQYVLRGKHRLVPAIDGQIARLEATTRMHRQRIQEATVIRSRSEEVGLGILLVES
jgi:SNF2 family DNA or RNA helicase